MLNVASTAVTTNSSSATPAAMISPIPTQVGRIAWSKDDWTGDIAWSKDDWATGKRYRITWSNNVWTFRIRVVNAARVVE
ncbi:hypothetical protein KSX_91090 [Ktedonospora formicarum]|uniref:Uncharacterized protein n=1 Tax=Ktedonospora formicarum TaxID=2778364 RepID=A0A8J3I965_9CHLR|nr:hypothetical protein KSX_91090 [Ktedonospora formicarum]